MSWIDTTVGELADIKHGFAFKGEHFSDSGRYIVLTPGNCHNEGGFKHRGDREKWYSAAIPEGYLLAKDDLLVVMTDLVNVAPVLGGSFLIPEDDKYLHNQRLGLVSVLDEQKADKRFLYYLLNTHDYRGQVRGSASGATVRHTSPGRIKACTVKIPREVAEQQRIAATLSAYDDLIENNRRRIALLEEAARQLYKEWFVRFRFPGHEHVKIIDGVPEGWERTPASNILNVLSGGTPNTNTPRYWDGDIGFFTPKDAMPSAYVSITEKTITEAGLTNCNSELYPKDTLFITARGTVGKMNLAQVPMAMNQSCYALVSNTLLSQRFLYLTMDDSLQQLRSQASGAVFAAIIVSTFDRILVTKPDEKIAAAFDDFVNPIFDQIAILGRQTEQLGNARDLLLPRLMSGSLAA